MKLTKKEFEEKFLSKDKNKELDEFHEPNDDFGGDTPVMNTNHVFTDTPKAYDDKSEFEKGTPTTTNDFSKTKNTLSKNHPYGPNQGGYTYGDGTRFARMEESEVTEESKVKMEKMIKELLSKYNTDRDIVNKTNDSEINDGEVENIDKISDPTVISKTGELVSAINGTKLNDKELEVIFNHIKNNIKR